MKKKKDKKVDIDIGKIWEKYRYVSGLDIKLPKFNLKKIDAKKVLGLLNSGDRENRKKSVSLLFEAYSKRYFEIAQSVADSKPSNPHAFIWEWYSEVKGDTQSLKTEDEEEAQNETEKNEALRDIFWNIENDETKPTSEKDIGVWLDNAVKNYANDKMSFNHTLHCYWHEPPQDVQFIAFAGKKIDRQPFNLEKIDTKEVLRLLNSEDTNDIKKAASLLFEGYSKRYLEIALKTVDPIIGANRQLEYIFHNCFKPQTIPTSEKEIGKWLDYFVLRSLYNFSIQQG